MNDLVSWIVFLLNIVYIVIGVVEALTLRRYMIDKVVIYPKVSTALPFIYVSISCILIGIDLYMSLTYSFLPLVIVVPILIVLILASPTTLTDDKILHSYKIFRHIDKISDPLVILLKDEKVPKHCLKLIKRTILFDIGIVDKKCLNKHINSIVSKYKKVDICLVKAENIKQYEKCLKNIEKHGIEPNCFDYVLDEKKYKICIEASKYAR